MLLEYASAALRSMREGNYTEAQAVMGMMVRLPPNVEHNLKTFITLVNELATILDSSNTGLDELQELIGDGAVASARQKIPQVESLLSDASNRLELLFSSLDRINAVYRIDVGAPRKELQALALVLQEYERRLVELKALLQETDVRVETQLNLSVTPNPVWVEKNVTITGQLVSRGVGLAGRIVELWIAAPAYARYRVTLDQNGAFESTYQVSSSQRLSNLKIFTRYLPAGDDLQTFRPARSKTITVAVNYYPVRLTVIPSSERVHVLEEFTVEGKLTDASGHPLASETVQLMIDNSTVMVVQTNEVGAYHVTTSFPSTAREGAHDLYARFNPTGGIYAAASSEKMQIQLYYLRPTIRPAGGEILAFSGQSLVMEGRLELDSKPLSQGLVVAYLEGQELSRALSDANGLFKMTFVVPFDATGDNALKIVFVPKAPWFTSTASSVILRVLNTAITALGIGVVACVGLIITGRSLRPRPQLELPRAPTMRPKPETIVERKLEAKTIAPRRLTPLRAADLRKFEDPRVCVRETYWIVRGVLAETLHDPGRVSETHREYAARVTRILDSAASTAFSSLTRLFELAEYSQHPLSRTEAAEAIDHGILVSELMNVKMMP